MLVLNTRGWKGTCAGEVVITVVTWVNTRPTVRVDTLLRMTKYCEEPPPQYDITLVFTWRAGGDDYQSNFYEICILGSDEGHTFKCDPAGDAGLPAIPRGTTVSVEVMANCHSCEWADNCSQEFVTTYGG